MTTNDDLEPMLRHENLTEQIEHMEPLAVGGIKLLIFLFFILLLP